VVDRNLAIEALKKEVDTLKAEKTRLAREVGGLCTTQGDL
jgi:cell division protein FtsB